MALRRQQTSVLQSQVGLAPCILTWYDPALGGTNSGTGRADPNAKTASGEPYDPAAMTCAAPPQYPFGTVISFVYNGRAVSCRVNDRGGAITGAHFDLSRAAATALGMINTGTVQARFAVTGGQGGAGPIDDILNTASDLIIGGPADAAKVVASGDVFSRVAQGLLGLTGDVVGQLATVVVGVAKEAVIGLYDVVWLPWWHWNQRAAQYYQSSILADTGDKHWTALPWNAAFWGFGYWLLFTDPNESGLAPAPVRRSRLAHHVRAAQAVPAKRSLIKPKDVQRKTPKKPSPVVSHARITQVGTMGTQRPQRVKVYGSRIGDTSNVSEVNVDRAGSVHGSTRGGSQSQAETAHDPAHRKRNASDRTGNGSLQNRGRTPTRNSGESGDKGSGLGRGPIPDNRGDHGRGR